MYALINGIQLILGPIGFNYRMINSELEELGLLNRVLSNEYINVPIKFNNDTFLLPAIQNIPNHDPRFQEIGNFTWEIIKENDIPVRVEMDYPISDKTLEQIKKEYIKNLSPLRREKEITFIDIKINETTFSISTNRENRLSYVSKLISSPGPHKFKFNTDTWLEITVSELQYIISQIDLKVQEAFDWEYQKTQEINACTTGQEVYNVIIRTPQQTERENAVYNNN